MSQPKYPRKYRIWRLLAGKTLAHAARDLRLPAYIVSAIERGDVEPSDRWKRRFEEVYGIQVAVELLAPVDLGEALGPAIARLAR
jgi:ribosome-binding protein aMBF1 (putative translation factor)